MKNQPTAEQQHCLDLFATGEGMAVMAGAGTGKTSTLEMLGYATTRPGQYTAFNRAIVDEAATRMPGNVAANTMHGMAMRAVGGKFRHRLNTGRVSSAQLARILKLDPVVVDTPSGKRKVVQPSHLASMVMKAMTTFAASDDPAPWRAHIPYVNGLDSMENGRRTWTNNEIVRGYLEPFLLTAWADLSDPAGTLPYRHDYYLKLWELNGPRIAGDFILYDEAQDASPVQASIVFQQKDAQLVVVGDPEQGIYEWRGAVDALTVFAEQGVPVAQLSQSFRFGPAIAEVANKILRRCYAEMQLAGTESVDSRIGYLADSEIDAILCRTNAKAVNTVLNYQKAGRKVVLLGGGAEVVRFAKAAQELKDGRPTTHPELVCFESWAEVLSYVDEDPSGDELALLVQLVDQFGADAIIAALEGMGENEDGAVVVSTAHKAKGREWNRVRLADDFPDPSNRENPRGEWRLLYVAVTRARHVLDPGLCVPVRDLLAGNKLAQAFLN